MVDLSIVIINKNYKDYLKYCIESCLSQKTKFKYEILFSDDGSTDGSIEYIKSLRNNKIKCLVSKNKGIEIVSNKALKKARGKFVVRVDSDDLLKKNFVEIMLTKIQKTNYSFAYSNYHLINKKGKMIKNVKLPQFDKNEIFSRGDFLASGTVFLKKHLKKLNFYNVKYKNSGLENYELILKLLLINKKGKHINKNLFYYRKHKKNYSITKRKRIVKYGNLMFNKLKIGKYTFNKYHPLA